jgi:hypothetical protein
VSAPGFLVVGAQKCGTTTLFEDLRSHPDIYVPDKESSGLLDPRLPEPAAVEGYRALFSAARGRLAGEVSTEYTMLPANDVATLAREVIGPARILYVVREPVARTISHHHHYYAAGLMSDDIDSDVPRHPELVDNSRYAMQIEPWLRAFGPSAVKVIRFESFVADRQTTADEVFAFLGVRAWTLPAADRVHNAASDKVVAVGTWQRVSESPLYRHTLRRVLSEPVRRRLLGLVLPKAKPRPPAPAYATVETLVAALRPDVERLGEITGEGPWWDLDAVLASYRPSITSPGGG